MRVEINMLNRVRGYKKSIFCFLAGFILMGCNELSAQGNAEVGEYDLKAAFLSRFIEYVDWKNNAESETFSIAILEESPITLPLLEITKDKKAKNKKINVKQYKNMDDIGFCNILFVPENSSVAIETILSIFAGKPVLIVTEHEGYGKKGAQMNFVIVDNKLKFEVNLKAINKAEIIVSSFLLQHAIIINE